MKTAIDRADISNTRLPCVTIVVIGLNEEMHLKAVFASIGKQSYPRDRVELIYVDSGSHDGSTAIAKRNADKVFDAISLYPTAARGRNAGLAQASHRFIHFLDGDTEIGPDYLEAAITRLLADVRLAGVIGYIDEKNRDRNKLNLLYSSALSKKAEGFVTQPKAGGTFRTDFLRSIGGYDERVKLGEETELGDRILRRGYKILQIKETMGIHDYDFHGLSSLTRLYVKMGEALAIQSRLNGEGDYWKKTKRHNSTNLILNLLLLTALVGSCFSGIYYLVLAFCLFILVWPVVKLYVRRDLTLVTLVYYEVMAIMKPVTFWGQLKAYTRLALDREFRLHVIIPKTW